MTQDDAKQEIEAAARRLFCSLLDHADIIAERCDIETLAALKMERDALRGAEERLAARIRRLEPVVSNAQT